MILTQELWQEYTTAVSDEINWYDLVHSNLITQACAAANATNWKLEQVLKQNAELVEAIKITLDTCSVIIILPEHSDDGNGHGYCFVCGADHDEPHDDDCIIPKLQAVIAKATGGE